MNKTTLLLGVMCLIFSFSSCSTAAIEKAIITEPVTYDMDVSVIISNNCLPCHAGAFAAGSLNLEGYANVRTAAENRNLLARINSVSNPMPQNGQMAPVLIATLEQWAIDGYIEN